MGTALFKLESFAAIGAGSPAPAYTHDELQQAFADGLAEGQVRAEDADLRSLCAGLDQLRQTLTDDETRRATIRDEAVAALTPILSQILDCLAPAAQSQRLEQALVNELARLAQMAQPLRASITCGPRLHALVQRCITASGISGIEMVETDTDRINLSVQGGQIEFSPMDVRHSIAGLISELQDGDAWTR